VIPGKLPYRAYRLGLASAMAPIGNMSPQDVANIGRESNGVERVGALMNFVSVGHSPDTDGSRRDQPNHNGGTSPEQAVLTSYVKRPPVAEPDEFISNFEPGEFAELD
jgi:hypothetical protein